MTDKLRTAAQRAMKAIISSPNGISDEMFESWMDLRAALAEDAMQRLTDVQQEIEQPTPTPPCFPVSQLKLGCAVCGIGADGAAYGYVCSRSDCPTRVTCGGTV